MKIIHILYIFVFLSITSCDLPFLSGSGGIAFNNGDGRKNEPYTPTTPHYTLAFPYAEYLYNYNLTQNAAILYTNVISDTIISCEVTPSLPGNLTMNMSDCTISGIATTIIPKSTYHLKITTINSVFEGDFTYGVYVEACDPASVTSTGALRGSGDASDPYIICNSSQLDEYLTTYSGSGYAKIQNDMVITRSTSLGELNNANLDGAGHVITANINSSKTMTSAFDHYGLFSKITSSTVKRITLKGSVSGRDFVGSLAGEITASDISFIHVEKSFRINGNYVGGLIGYNTMSSVSTFSNSVIFPIIENNSSYFYPLFANMENIANQNIHTYYFGASSVIAGSLSANTGTIIGVTEYSDSLSYLTNLDLNYWNISSNAEPSLKVSKEKIYE